MADVKKTRVGNTPHSVTTYEETLRKKNPVPKTQQEAVNESTTRAAAARKAGAHGSSLSSDGSKFVTPQKKRSATSTDGGGKPGVEGLKS